MGSSISFFFPTEEGIGCTLVVLDVSVTFTTAGLVVTSRWQRNKVGVMEESFKSYTRGCSPGPAGFLVAAALSVVWPLPSGAILFLWDLMSEPEC